MAKIIIDTNSLSSITSALNKALDENKKAINKINSSINIIGGFSMPNKASYISELENAKKNINKNIDLINKYISIIKKTFDSFKTKDHSLKANYDYSYTNNTNISSFFSLRNQESVSKAGEISSLLIGGAVTSGQLSNESPVKGFFSKIGDAFGKVKDSVSDKWNSFITGCKEIENSVSNYFSNEWDGFKTAVKEVFGEETVSYAWETTKDVLKGLGSVLSIAVAVSPPPDAVKMVNETYKLCNYFTATVNDLSASLCSLQANYTGDETRKKQLLEKAKADSEVEDLSDYFRAGGMNDFAAGFDTIDAISNAYGVATGIDKITEIAANGLSFDNLLNVAGIKKIDLDSITTFKQMDNAVKDIKFGVDVIESSFNETGLDIPDALSEGWWQSSPGKIIKGFDNTYKSEVELIQDIVG